MDNLSKCLRVAGFLDNSLVNGEGLRSVLFVSGCKHKCPGCHNASMQDFDYGDSVSLKEILGRIENNVPLINGVTFSGGDPFEHAEVLSELAEEIKDMGLNIWCYSGYTYEEIMNSKDESKISLLNKVDVLVDGRFDASKKGRGSEIRGFQQPEDIKTIINVKPESGILTLDSGYCFIRI